MSAPPTRPDVLTAFRACRLWHAASDEAVAALAATARVHQSSRGSMLATEGEPATDVCVLVSGKARVFHLQADGRTITLETVESGEAFAAVAALAGGRYPANVDAATDVTIACIDRETLFALLPGEPDVARSLVSDLAERVMNLTRVVQSLSLDVPGRLAGYLFQRALAVGEATPEGLRVTLGMTKAELASSLGTVPETLSRAFARLRDEDVLIVRGSEVMVLDVGALARLGAGYEEG